MGSFNPHPRRGAGAALRLILAHEEWVVSILTRAEARVLQPIREVSPDVLAVSILTRAEARVLQATNQISVGKTLFQSSPAPRRGCCSGSVNTTHDLAVFQSSPAPRRGCCTVL